MDSRETMGWKVSPGHLLLGPGICWSGLSLKSWGCVAEALRDKLIGAGAFEVLKERPRL